MKHVFSQLEKKRNTNTQSREQFLLHVCCAPCSIAVIDELATEYDLVVLFYNPNIHPEEEYLKRKREVVRVCEEWKVPMIDHDYDIEKWEKDIRGLENEPEGGLRCVSCISMRLLHTAEIAKEKNIELFGTTLTMGRNKREIVITPLGKSAGEKYGREYYVEDWKKKGREIKARAMVKERDIYRQTYCGCKYSIRVQREE
ncbi:MAG: epoxyqueuosine reductase QueH [Candidatus Moranbacteria bacterium]|nr:epoxyqueuosine reductase QueH [Candidatus Moranbacteria bacterium]MDD3965294.1 epoxyqueuosine reductase QueH [Candidatus Moranbacteria bacterium]